jgi:probable HAF family extracellular repeat protein
LLCGIPLDGRQAAWERWGAVRIFARLAILTAAPSLLAARVAAVGPYQIVDLGTLGGSESRAYAVNADGDVVGSASTAGGATHGFFYHAGTLTDLGTLQGGTFSVALAVNSDGLVVGYADTGAGDQHAIWWSAGLGLTDLGTLPGTTCSPSNQPCSIARGVSETGKIVGEAANGSKRDAFVTSVGKPLTDVPASTFKGGSPAILVGINSHDHAAGYFCPAKVACSRLNATSPTDPGYAKVEAVYYSLSGTWYPLPPFLSGDTSLATAINESNQVVGGANTTPGGPLHAFLSNATSQNRQLVDLGSLGGPASIAYAINGAGEVVGSAERPDGTSHAVLWEVPGSPPVSLEGLIPAGSPWTSLEVATGINDAGLIVGWGVVGGHRHAFLLVPGIGTTTTTVPPGGTTTTTLAPVSSCETAAAPAVCFLRALRGALASASSTEVRGDRLRRRLDTLINKAVFQVTTAGSERSRARRLRAARRALRGFLATLRRGTKDGRVDGSLALSLQTLAESALAQLGLP